MERQRPNASNVNIHWQLLREMQWNELKDEKNAARFISKIIFVETFITWIQNVDTQKFFSCFYIAFALDGISEIFLWINSQENFNDRLNNAMQCTLNFA